MNQRWGVRVVVFWAMMYLYGGAIPVAADSVDFAREIRPILSDTCFHCHGPDGAKRKSGLRLDLKSGALASAIIVPGSPEKSKLIYRIFSSDPDERMPPPDSGRSLTPGQRNLLRQWIEEGAVWEEHWSFVAVKCPEVPDVSSSAIRENGIDSFIQQKLVSMGMSPSPQADRETLIRRVTLDLIGLPPTLEEIDAFLQDEAPGAYARVVDRLLTSSRYGEHMALDWLDAARYADTDGYQNDGPRSMWRWRDWVIEAYNRNLPFDQFTIEQLAGDLLPNPSLDQRIATGFNRNHRYNSESGLVLDEFLLENAVDRVDTTATVWMGITMGCARCHDHKYDPFSQEEYYQLISFFNNIPESGRAIKFGNSEPWISAPTRAQQRELKAHRDKIEMGEKILQKAQSRIRAEMLAWENEEPNEMDHPIISHGLTEHFPLEAFSETVKKDKGQPVFGPGLRGQAVTLRGHDVLTLGKVGQFGCTKRFSLAVWIRPKNVDSGVILSRQAGNSTRPGMTLELRDGHLGFFIITRWIAGVGAVETLDRIPVGQWTHVALSHDGSQRTGGMRIYVDGRLSRTKLLYNTNSNVGGGGGNAPFRIGAGTVGTRFHGQVDDLMIFDRTLFEDEVLLLSTADSVAAILNKEAGCRSTREQDYLRAWFLKHAASPDLKKLESELLNARLGLVRFQDSLPTAMVMREASGVKPTHVRVRGVYHQLGDRVKRDVPEIFPRMEQGVPPNRLGFARWLVSGSHPLTARVAVNRYWQKYFGRGLVKTMEDFGVQGEAPSHPALLDWLASEFLCSGWDIKGMQKQIVMSATYRQSSRITPRQLEQDPENRWYGRGPRFRLSAHALRDQALALSGLLEERIGGPSVSPYQPDKLWVDMSNMKYKPSKGADLFRRSLYTLWKRTVAPPSMAVMDAADREVCSIKRHRTNTPLQALTLLNEKAFFEAARNLGERILKQGGSQPVVFGFRTVTGRYPRAEEERVLRHAYAGYLESLERHPDQAKEMIRVGESKVAEELDPVEYAAATVLANLLLNLDEVLTKQ